MGLRSIRWLAVLAFFIAPAVDSAPQSDTREHLFNVVWARVNERHFDPTFNGVDLERAV